MKRVLSSVVLMLATLGFAAGAHAIPATGGTSSAISVITGQDKTNQAAQKKKTTHKKTRKHSKKSSKRQATPAAGSPEAGSGSPKAPETSATPPSTGGR